MKFFYLNESLAIADNKKSANLFDTKFSFEFEISSFANCLTTGGESINS